MNTDEKYKVYLFYLKETGKLYAFTICKQLKNEFLLQRNKKAFYLKKVIMDEMKFSLFLDKYRNLMLIQIPLGISLTEYQTVIGTLKEETGLEMNHDDMETDLNQARLSLMQYNFKSKYMNAIDYIGTVHVTVNKEGRHNLLSTINDFRLFYNLYKNTFNDIKKDE